MENLYEDLVLWKITRDPLVFANRQYTIEKGWSCPDIVALNFRKKEIWVIEVSTGDAKGLAEKVRDRENQWFSKLGNRLEHSPASIIDGSWKFVAKVFIRRDAEKGFRKMVGEHLPEDVTIEILEDIGFNWQWNWEFP